MMKLDKPVKIVRVVVRRAESPITIIGTETVGSGDNFTRDFEWTGKMIQDPVSLGTYKLYEERI
jgi:hypothetical protein